MAVRDELCPEVREEYLRWLKLMGEEDPYAGPNTLGVRDVLRAHFLIADFFYREGEGLGGIGPRDLDLLHSALYRQHVSLGGKPKWETKFDICATLMFGLIKDHPFHDANKRTAFLSSLYYLYDQGRTPKISHKEFEDFTVDIADDNLVRYRRYKEYVKKRKKDPEVLFISDFLKRNTRNIDKREYIVTFHELKKILNRFNCDLTDPQKNFSEVIKYRKKKRILKRKEYWVEERVMQVACPGMSREVPLGTIRDIRKNAKLSHENGVDSQTFFKGMDTMGTLISHYREQLFSLAKR